MPGNVDWYAAVELSYSLGHLGQGGAQAAYLKARRAELSQSRHELLARVEEVRTSVSAQREATRGELGAVEKELFSIKRTREALSHARSAGGQQVLDALRVEEFLVEADRVFLTTLLTSLTDISKEDKGTTNATYSQGR